MRRATLTRWYEALVIVLGTSQGQRVGRARNKLAYTALQTMRIFTSPALHPCVSSPTSTMIPFYARLVPLIISSICPAPTHSHQIESRASRTIRCECEQHEMCLALCGRRLAMERSSTYRTIVAILGPLTCPISNSDSRDLERTVGQEASRWAGLACRIWHC